MPKPICVIKVHESITIGTPKFLGNILHEIQENLQKRFSEYHVLTLPLYGDAEEYSQEPIQLQVFYDKDFTETNFGELKEMVATELENLKPPTNDAGKY